MKRKEKQQSKREKKTKKKKSAKLVHCTPARSSLTLRAARKNPVLDTAFSLLFYFFSPLFFFFISVGRSERKREREMSSSGRHHHRITRQKSGVNIIIQGTNYLRTRADQSACWSLSFRPDSTSLAIIYPTRLLFLCEQQLIN